MAAICTAMVVSATGQKPPEETQDAGRIWAEKLSTQAPNVSKATLRHVYRTRPESEMLALLAEDDGDIALAAREALWAIWWQDLDSETQARAEEIATLHKEGRNRHALILCDYFWGGELESAELLLLRGRLEAALGLYDLAMASLKKAAARNQNHWPSLQMMAIIAVRSQDWEAARDALLNLKKLIPAFPNVDRALTAIDSPLEEPIKLGPGLRVLNVLPSEFMPPDHSEFRR